MEITVFLCMQKDEMSLLSILPISPYTYTNPYTYKILILCDMRQVYFLKNDQYILETMHTSKQSY